MALIKTPDGGFYFDDSQVDIDYEANSVTLLAGGGDAGVVSFNGRNGAVVPAEGDYTSEMVGAVPVTRTVNGKALSNDIQLTAQDVGAADSETLNNVSDTINSLPNQMFVDLVNVQRTATTNTAEIQIATKQENGTYSTAVQHDVLTLIGAGQGADGVNGAGLMIASDKAKLDGIPTPTTDDNGKVLCVENGAYVLKTLAELQG